VDATRLGIWGWSYGGYETTFAVTHAPTVWKTGVAVAPVTDWASYDSIYTERYMGTPQAFPAAYAASSSVAAAGRLRAHLLISHGTSDDNVHLANSIALLQACVLAGKQVDFMVRGSASMTASPKGECREPNRRRTRSGRRPRPFTVYRPPRVVASLVFRPASRLGRTWCSARGARGGKRRGATAIGFAVRARRTACDAPAARRSRAR
jgi:hypothetical protein